MAFYATRKVNYRFHNSLTLLPIQNKTNPVHVSHPTSLKFILILSSHLRLGLASCLFPSGSQNKSLYTFLSFPPHLPKVPSIPSSWICSLEYLLYDIFVNCNWVSPGGRSTVHIYTQTIHRTIQNKQYIEQHNNFGRVRAMPRLGYLYPGICLTTEGKTRKSLSQGR